MRIARTLLLAATALVAIAALAHDSKDGFSYLYARDGSHHMVVAGGSFHLGHLDRLKSKHSGKFFWFTEGNEEYVIRDAATLAEIDRLFSSMRALDPERDAIRHRLRPLEEEERALEMKMDALSDRMDDADELSEATVRQIESKMRDLEIVMRRLESRMREVEREERRIDDKLDALEKEAERKLEPLLKRAIREGKARRE